MKKIIFAILSIFIFASCGEENTESSKLGTEKQKSQQLLPASSDSIAILKAKAIDIFKSPYIYKWGTSYNYICFQPVKSYKGSFNDDLFAIDFETHWKMDSIHDKLIRIVFLS
jgi:PBP1b-binding outer membrane lipoprotein LpoB